MTFNIHKLTLSNFRSYKGTHKFTLPIENGLYYLTGKNLLEPTLGANGAGKSTLLDAITWALYGRTTRGLKATDVLTWHGAASAQVTVELAVGDQELVIKRSQKPNNLTVNDKPVDQKELETFIRLNYAAFTHTVLNPQFGESFFSMSASDKLALFSDFMGLNLWLEKAEEASKLARENEQQERKLHDVLTADEARLSTILEDIDRLETDIADYENQREVDLFALENDHADNTKRVRKLEKARAALKLSIEQSETQLEAANTRQRNMISERDNLLNQMSNESAHRKQILRQQETTLQKLKRFEDFNDGACPFCEQDLIKKNIEKSIGAYQAHLDTLKVFLDASDDNLKAITREIVRAKARLAECEDEAKEAFDVLTEAKRDFDRNVERAKSVEALLESLKTTMSKLTKAINPHKETMLQKKKVAKALEASIDTHKTQLNEVEVTLAANLFWAKGFKRLRLFVIEAAFRDLELEVNNCLTQLGMSDWHVSFDVERENKSGGVTKGFVVLIKSPANKEPVKWENWSGGETQRLQLAGDLGLSNLIMQQAGLKSEIEFYDEPSTHLSPEGMMDLADTLHERAISEGKRIWIADHAAISSFGDFKGIILVRKDKNGSSITTR